MDSTLKGTLTNVQISPTSFCDLRDNLERLGLSDLSMFPDLEGVCRYITWNNSLLGDERDHPNVPLNQVV